MMTSSKVLTFSGDKLVTIKHWKASVGDLVSQGSVLFSYAVDGSTTEAKFRCDRSGTLEQILVGQGEQAGPAVELAVIGACTHPTVMKDMCAECGADLRQMDADGTSEAASVAMLHSIPELKISKRQAESLGKKDMEQLLKHKKLVLLVDLDQTLVHTTNDDIPPNIKDVFHFQMYGPKSQWYHTRLRPGTRQFLEKISRYFELHICTFGARLYAHTIAGLLDPEGVYFSHRILSRDECFSPLSKTANLKSLFPCGEHMVCIIDDREDVWNFASNLIHVKPYHFFKHTGDINAPPGLDKSENDEKEGFDFSKLPAADDRQPVPASESELQRRDSMPNLSDDEDEATKVVDAESSEAPPAAAETIEELNADLSLSEDEMEGSQTVQSKSGEKSLPVTDSKSGVDGGRKESDETKDCSKRDQTSSSSATDAAEGGETSSNGVGKSTSQDIDIPDEDDYLLHLEEILIRIHQIFYSMLDKSNTSDEDSPDLRLMIPYVRKKILKGVRLVFSGIVPSNQDLAASRPYQITVALGATVHERIVRKGSKDQLTTHVVAARLGTAKVNEAMRSKRVRVVTPDWLWSCAERWERVDERLFPLTAESAVNRQPPVHCSSPNPDGERTNRQRFQESLNPLLAFSPDDIARMDEEVEDILQSGSDEDEDPPDRQSVTSRQPPASSSDSEVDEDGEDQRPARGSSASRKRRPASEDGSSDDEEEESPSVKFRRGCRLPSDEELGGDGNGNDDETDDGGPDLEEDWSMMGAELERELGAD